MKKIFTEDINKKNLGPTEKHLNRLIDKVPPEAIIIIIYTILLFFSWFITFSDRRDWGHFGLSIFMSILFPFVIFFTVIIGYIVRKLKKMTSKETLEKIKKEKI